MRKVFILCIASFIMVIPVVRGGLFDPAILNPSFESPDLGAGGGWVWDRYADDWVLNGYEWGFLEDGSWFPSADGINTWKLWAGAYIWQQIGTWDEGFPYEITVAVGRYDDDTGATISLWAGGDPALTPEQYGEIEATVGATQVDEAFVQPSVAVGENEDMTVVLNTGTGFTTGDALWIRILASAGEATYVDNIRIVTLDTAVNVAPSNGAENVAITTLLEWEAPVVYVPSGYDVYLGTDANELSPYYYGNNLVVDNEDVTSYNPGGLDYITTYYWRVDAYEPNDLGPGSILHVGGLWSFTTAPPEPIIQVEPYNQTVPAGSEVSLVVSGVNIESYAWYEESAPTTVLSTTNTLTIASMGLLDEGFYYCEVSNTTSPVVKTSVTARLLTQRLIAHWKFENDLTDEGDAFNGTLVDPNTSNPDPTIDYAAGIDGQAAVFTGSGKYIEIPGTDYFNFYPDGFTVSAWIKRTSFGSGGWWDGVVCKGGTTSGWRIDSVYPNGWIGGWLGGNVDGEVWAPGGIGEDEQWHLAVISYDAVTGTFAIYADGVISSSSVNDNEVPASDEPITIGARNVLSEYPFTGMVDEVMIWTYPLDIYTIAYMYTDLVEDASVCPDDTTGLQFDFNDNCRIDLGDLAIFASTWMNCNLVPDCK